MSLLGDIFGGSQRKAAETIRQDDRIEAEVPRRQLGMALYGPEFNKYLTDLQFATSELLAGRPDALNKFKTPDSVQKAMVGPYGGANIFESMDRLGNSFARQGRQGYNQFNADSAGINQQARGLQALAANYGANRNAVIDADAKRSLTDMNAATQARLMASGLGGSTLTTNQMAGNAERVFQRQQEAKQNAADQATQVQMGAGRTALDSLTGQQGMRSNLYNSLLGQRYNMRMVPMNARYTALSGGTLATPWQSSAATTSGIVSNTGGLGNAIVDTIGTLGGAYLGGLGGQNGSSGLSNSQLSRLFDGLRANPMFANLT